MRRHIGFHYAAHKISDGIPSEAQLLYGLHVAQGHFPDENYVYASKGLVRA
jgi:hypothetical protein